MKQYILDLLKRVSTYSKTLDQLTSLKEFPWVTINEQGNKVKYIFRRNGDLLISESGRVKIGHWEYLEMAQSLLVTVDSEKLLLNHGFLDENALVLIVDGTEDIKFFANQSNLNDGDPVKYLNNLSKNNLSRKNSSYFKKPDEVNNQTEPELFTHKVKCVDGSVLIIKSKNKISPQRGDQVLINNKIAPDNDYKISPFNVLRVLDGKVQ